MIKDKVEFLKSSLLINYKEDKLSNGKTITPTFGQLLLLPFSVKKSFHSPAMQRFFNGKWEQNKLIQFDGLIISSLLRFNFLK